MTPLDEKIADANKFMSAINSAAYKDIFLLSNQVFSKNPAICNFLKRFLAGEKPDPHSSSTILLKLLIYYCKSFLHFLLYLSQFCQYLLCCKRYNHIQPGDELIVIDTHFLNDKISEANDYKDPYFPGLEELLKKLNKNYVYLPVFYNANNGSIKTFNLCHIFKILDRTRTPVLTEHQLLSIGDLFLLLHFAVVYPFHVLRFIRTLRSDKYEISLLKYELLDTIDQVTFYGFSRYLQGKKIAELPYKKIKVISWYENQIKHKNLFKGLRLRGDKVTIYGAQLFLFSKNLVNVLPDDSSEIIGITPDKIICNGRYYIRTESRLSYIVGPSLRYSRLFNTIVANEDRKDILVLLPYFDKEIRNILQLLNNTDLSSFTVKAKFHPATSIDKYNDLLHGKIEIVNDDIYELFKKAKIVIGSGSGTLIEAASLGIPVIVIPDRNQINYNPLPEFGRGVIWTEAYDSGELFRQLNAFEAGIGNDAAEIGSVAGKYKEMFFQEPSEENMIRAFDLLNTCNA